MVLCTVSLHCTIYYVLKSEAEVVKYVDQGTLLQAVCPGNSKDNLPRFRGRRAFTIFYQIAMSIIPVMWIYQSGI